MESDLIKPYSISKAFVAFLIIWECYKVIEGNYESLALWSMTIFFNPIVNKAKELDYVPKLHQILGKLIWI